MRKKTGFTLIELMVVIAIIGIMAGSAIPLYSRYMQRSVGSEATVMLRQILNAQIMYYLENETFFPKDKMYIINHSGQIWPGDEDELNAIQQALKIDIPVGHFLDFTIMSDSVEGECTVTISSPQNSFPLFKNGDAYLIGIVDKNGYIDLQLEE